MEVAEETYAINKGEESFVYTYDSEEQKWYYMKGKKGDSVIDFNFDENADFEKELDEYLASQDLEEETLKDYKELYLKQYSNLKYDIKDEKINGDSAIVEVQITVFDYYKSDKLAGDYFTANQADFVDDDGDIDFSKYFAYKIRKMLDTTDTVDYTLTINLKKKDSKWEVEPLTHEELTKLHGTYEY